MPQLSASFNGQNFWEYYSLAFKAKVDPRCRQGQEGRYRADQRVWRSPNQISEWKKQLVEGRPEISSNRRRENIRHLRTTSVGVRPAPGNHEVCDLRPKEDIKKTLPINAVRQQGHYHPALCRQLVLTRSWDTFQFYTVLLSGIHEHTLSTLPRGFYYTIF